MASTSRRARFVLLACLLGLGAFYTGVRLATFRSAAPKHPITGRQIAGIATNANWMERSEREEEEQPDRALDLIGIRPGEVVADIGAGSGYMTIRLAHRVGRTGQVYANDVQPALLALIAQKLESQHLSNVEIVQGTKQNARLPEAAIDLELLVDVYHELWYPQAMLQSLRRALKPRGELVLIEYRKEDPTIPIAPTHRMSVAEAKTEVEAEGFTLGRTIEDLPRQHIIVFTTGKAGN